MSPQQRWPGPQGPPRGLQDGRPSPSRAALPVGLNDHAGKVGTRAGGDLLWDRGGGSPLGSRGPVGPGDRGFQEKQRCRLCEGLRAVPPQPSKRRHAPNVLSNNRAGCQGAQGTQGSLLWGGREAQPALALEQRPWGHPHALSPEGEAPCTRTVGPGGPITAGLPPATLGRYRRGGSVRPETRARGESVPPGGCVLAGGCAVPRGCDEGLCGHGRVCGHGRPRSRDGARAREGSPSWEGVHGCTGATGATGFIFF